MELYINNRWTECYGNSYIAEAIFFFYYWYNSEIYTTGVTAEEADAKLMSALRELELIPQKATKDR